MYTRHIFWHDSIYHTILSRIEITAVLIPMYIKRYYSSYIMVHDVSLIPSYIKRSYLSAIYLTYMINIFHIYPWYLSYIMVQNVSLIPRYIKRSYLTPIYLIYRTNILLISIIFILHCGTRRIENDLFDPVTPSQLGIVLICHIEYLIVPDNY